MPEVGRKLEMNALEPAPLTAGGLLVMREEEVELKADTDGIHFYTQNGKTKQGELFTGVARGHCQVVLTNLRLLAIVPTAEGGRVGWGINLVNVVEVEDCAVNLFLRSTRIRVHVRKSTPRDGVVDVDIGIGFEREGVLGDIGVKEERKDVFIELIRKALLRKSWLVIEASNRERRLAEEMVASAGKLNTAGDDKLAGTMRGAVTGVGVGGLLKRQEKALSEAEKLTKEATGDLDSLMERAREVVRVVEKFAKLAEDRTKDSADNDNGADDDDDTASIASSSTGTTSTTNDVESILQSIGMVSPVTKYSAGRIYHKQLARQLADLLSTQSRLQRMGGMVTLSDLYCILNRARGTELVSPDDLYRSARLMGRLKVGMHLVKFPSGVNMIRSDDLGDEAIFKRLMSLFDSTDPLTGITTSESDSDGDPRASNGLLYNEVASLLGVSLVVAKEQVLMAEQHGLLCRDDSVYGVAFFSISYFG